MENIQQYISDILPQLGSILGQFFSQIAGMISYAFSWLHDNPISAGAVYTQVIRWVMPLLALHILISVLREMLRVKNPKETWGYLYSRDLGRFPINHWECTVGRARHCDITVKFATISKTQCALMRNDSGQWFVHDLSGRGSTLINGSEAADSRSSSGSELKHGDTLSIGGVDLIFESITKQEMEIQQQKRIRKSSPLPPWATFITLTLFQLLTVIELSITRPDNIHDILSGFGLLCAVMWGYVIFTRALGQRGFEPEILAFFACTLDLAVTATSSPSIMFKQAIAIAIGVAGFMALGVYLRDLKRVVKTRKFMAAATVALFIINILCGKLLYGARNWISVMGVSVQPSEIAKICFIFAGAATLDRLFVKRNLFGFMCLSGFCLLALAITGDFGTAAIFFVVFLVIAFMRSGDFATLSLICGATAGAILMILRFKPYIAARFSVWGHVWEDASGMGYQQVRTMSASASGGLIGVGAGNGWLHNVAASNTDLVFGILCEEWGLIIALLAVAIIVVLSVFAFRVVQTGRSSYYTIAACSATSLLVFQTILNVFGSVDILPLTGVTFPFVSCGGTSMIASWCLLSYLKAADTRQNASFAVRKKNQLTDDVPDDPLTMIRGINANTNTNAKHPARGQARDTASRSRSAASAQLLSGNGGNNSTNKSFKSKNDDEIEAFLRQFDDPPAPGAGPPGGRSSDIDSGKGINDDDSDDIEAFFRKFDDIPASNDENDANDNDWGRR